ncbi:hypothetical protein EOD39_19323 [Acipenser ruthenus]|uniref:Uncharacterized protein n=1 Tax=Acipenser ruthenus TaxID=7906 RepID=A0A444UYF6_ACIRT|nr:hypothetical protein EOD39_19323 [Acipenser ruthenus]
MYGDRFGVCICQPGGRGKMKIALFLSACVLLLLQGSQGDTAVEAKNTQDALAEISPENKRELEAKNSQDALTEISPDSKRELADAGLQEFVDLHQGLLELKREIDGSTASYLRGQGFTAPDLLLYTPPVEI